jgi:hypothetical protein
VVEELVAGGYKKKPGEIVNVTEIDELTEILKKKPERQKFTSHQDIALALGLQQTVLPIGTGSKTGWEQVEKRGKIDIGVSQKPWPKFGRLKLENDNWDDSGFNEEGLLIKLEVISDPNRIWETGDLVELTLQKGKKGSLKIADLYIKKDGNAVQMTIQYSYADLEAMMDCPPDSVTSQPNKSQKRQALFASVPQIGVLATWRTQQGKGEQHRSGGIDQKMGSGLINVLDVTLPMLEKTESIRNINWSESEIATGKRPIVTKFPNLIQKGKEISTTLEAESEYLISEKDYQGILDKMSKFKAQKQLHEHYGLEKQKDVESEQKKYEDTYYDIDIGGTTNPLLEKGIVFRRRHVPKFKSGQIDQEGDPVGTRLIAIKGRSVSKGTESLRLASQFEAHYDLLDTDHQKEVLNFLQDEQKDNPFARTLLDALGGKDTLSRAKGLKKSIMVTSTRTKYKLWMPHGTMIDLSIDEAEGKMEGYNKKAKVWSFEFGVGHPGLSTSAGGGSRLSEEDPELNKLMRQQEQESVKETSSRSSGQSIEQKIEERKKETSAFVHRPYHTPQDLENPTMFAREDYKQYMALRDKMMKELFEFSNPLEKGGNKAKVLARKIQEERD